MYSAIFVSHIQIWFGLIRTFNFQPQDYYSSPLLLKLSLLKFEGKIHLKNVL